jgi:hypothetical protein
MAGEQLHEEQPHEFTDVCIANNFGELMTMIWHSLAFIIRDTSFIDLFWAWIPYISGVAVLLYILGNVQWIGSGGRDRSSSSGGRGRSSSKHRN